MHSIKLCLTCHKQVLGILHFGSSDRGVTHLYSAKNKLKLQITPKYFKFPEN